MGLLISLGVKQAINYIKSNKVVSIFVLLCIALVIVVSAMSVIDGSINTSAPMPTKLNISGLAFIMSLFALLLSFAQASTLLISKAEANTLFVSPIKASNILLYVFLKSCYHILLFLFIFTNLNFNVIAPLFNFNTAQIARLFIFEALLMSTCITVGMLFIVIRAKSILLFRIIEVFFFGIAIFIAFMYLRNLKLFLNISFSNIEASIMNLDFSILDSLSDNFNSYFNNDLFKFVPIAGLFITASDFIISPTTASFVNIGIIVIINILCLLSPNYIKANLAEPFIEIAETMSKRMKLKRKGSTIEVTNKTKGSIPIKATGIRSIVSKQLIDYRRNSKFFLSSNILTLMLIMGIYLVIIFFTNFAISKSGSSAPSDMMLDKFVAYLLIGVVFLVSSFLVSPLPKDIKNPTIFLIPGRAYKKILAISVISNMEVFIKSILIFIFSYFSNVGLDFSILLAIIYFLLMSCNVFIDMFSYSIFEEGILFILRGMLAGFFKMIVSFVIIGIYAIFVIFNYNATGKLDLINILGIITCILVALVIDFLIVFISEGVIDNRR